MRSRVLAHRGCWTSPGGEQLFEKNSKAAIEHAAGLGLGLETDIRDLDGRVVISHDPATRDTAVETDLSFVSRFEGPVALNVKSDGLPKLLSDLPQKHVFAENVFYFDMSYPEERRYRSHGLKVARRLSDFERTDVSGADWVWLDCFETDWFIEDLDSLLRSNIETRFCVVSPELHGREKQACWDLLSGSFTRHENLFLCTDFPEMFLAEFE